MQSLSKLNKIIVSKFGKNCIYGIYYNPRNYVSLFIKFPNDCGLEIISMAHEDGFSVKPIKYFGESYTYHFNLPNPIDIYKSYSEDEILSILSDIKNLLFGYTRNI